MLVLIFMQKTSITTTFYYLRQIKLLRPLFRCVITKLSKANVVERYKTITDYVFEFFLEVIILRNDC